MHDHVYDEAGTHIGILRGKWIFGPDGKAFGYVDEKLNIFDCEGNWTGKHLTIS
jgi:hypothetical protein